jgi:hypothetical protein
VDRIVVLEEAYTTSGHGFLFVAVDKSSYIVLATLFIKVNEAHVNENEGNTACEIKMPFH